MNDDDDDDFFLRTYDVPKIGCRLLSAVARLPGTFRRAQAFSQPLKNKIRN